jgi:hypothetical protein
MDREENSDYRLRTTKESNYSRFNWYPSTDAMLISRWSTEIGKEKRKINRDEMGQGKAVLDFGVIVSFS